MNKKNANDSMEQKREKKHNEKTQGNLQTENENKHIDGPVHPST
ncbi:hypothetical protein ALO_21616 [Acetonema longum DSM 6540]|uniref:Uncharacterized protein n=1 Tax=Acetonema longum DSM 6540 TaxID=1009370 RepID=F7NQC0_9FIRM|nr:hypothetical protein ALO_21616 [Acetonema longum DSM 6540]